MNAALAPLEGKYEIVAKIKEGGMGAIYRVRHRLLDEVRVVKVLRRQFEDDAELNERFIHEARSAIRLRHPNVVQIFDFLVEGGIGYIVMEYIDGVDLGELIHRRRRPSLPLFLEIACQSLRALGYLHQKGFVHRDVSPDNLMLAADFAGKPLVKMIDLGIAKKVEGGPELTADGMFLGKFRYSSPEHFGSQGAGRVEARSDLYSFGVVLYEFLTGYYPIRGEETSQLIAGHLFHPPASFEDSDPHSRVPKALREVLNRVLDKDPTKRFDSAGDFTAALAPLRKQFPVNEATMEEAGALRQLRGSGEPVEPGSTQSRLDRGFVHPTPAPATETQALPGVDGPAEADPRPSRETSPEDERRFDHHLHAACALAEEGNYAEAVPHFESALEIRGDNEAVRQMLSEAHEHLARERRASRARLENEVAQLERLAESGELDKTRARLLSARRAYGDAEPLAELERRIDIEQRLRNVRRIEEALHAAAAERRDGDLTLAVRKLEGARKAWRDAGLDDEEGRRLLERIDEEETALETAHREAAELDEAIFRIESCIEKRKLVEADRVLFQTIEAFGATAELRRLRDELARIHHRGLDEEIRTLLDESEQRIEAGEFSPARKLLEKARIMAPDDSDVVARIEERQAALLERQQAWKRQALDAAADEIEELLESDSLERAQARLAAAEAELDAAGTERFEALRQRIAEGFEGRVTALLHEAKVALEGRRYRAAVPFLEQAHELAPDDTWIADRLEQARAALAEPSDPAAESDVIEGLIEAKRIDEAERRLRRAIERWGANPDFDGLELQLEAGRLAERNEASLELAERAQAAYEEGDAATARRLAAEAIELSPMNAEARTLLELLERIEA